MGSSVDSKRGRAALMVAHCAGMVDLVALSVWVGALIAHYGFDPQRAGGLPTLFLVGAVLASVAVAPRIQRVNGRWVATAGFAISAVAFWLAAGTSSYAQLGMLHLVAGMSAGAALSVTHGTIARSANPHRLFAIAGMSLGVFAVAFLAGVPQLIAAQGGPVLFKTFAAVMGLGAVASLLAFPVEGTAATAMPQSKPAPLPRAVWFGILGISCMTLVQAMIFGFLEGVGTHRGFDRGAINGVLIVLGLVNLLPALLAALLQKRLSARKVLLAGPVVQCALAVTIMVSPAFGPYAFAAALLAAVLIFTHTFAFGLLAHLDTSGRTLTGTPAMLMVGSAIGPFLGGTLVNAFGYESLAVATAVLAIAAVACFAQLPGAAARR
ncbi:MAG: MFS transporter [Pseudomonadota bacterium]|nr:MFS transporter [Pseudomonadota bacterium]